MINQTNRSFIAINSFSWGLLFIELLIGGLLLLLFWWFDSAILKSVFLLLGIWLIVISLFRILNNSLISLPDGHCKRFASATAITLMAFYNILNSQSTIWIAFSWLFLIFGVGGMIAAAQRISIEGMLLPTLFRDYKAKKFPNLPCPLVYILAEPGIGVYYANRITAQVMHSILKYRGQRPIYFIISDSVRRYSLDFQEWLISQAAALVVVRLSHGFGDDKFEKMVMNSCKYSLGKIFMIYLQPEKENHRKVNKEGGILEISTSIRSFRASAQERVIASLTDDLAKVAYPIAESDSKLPKDLRPLIQQIAQNGLSPVASSYLRFRLAQSDVERLLCLLDCIEVLIKCSTIVLLINHWNRGGVDKYITVSSQLNRPSLGHWTSLLRELCKENVEDELGKTISTFWYRPLLHDAPNKLISDVNGSGLAWNGELPRSHMGWLDWFVWLRNATRGHGVVEEKLASPLWSGFHLRFLDMTRGLKELVLSSTIAVIKNDAKPTHIHGWNRNKYISSELLHEAQQFGKPYLLRKKSDAHPPLLLYPLIIRHVDSVLLWNSVRGDTIEYIDYSSGNLQRLEFLDTDPYSLWKQNRVNLA